MPQRGIIAALLVCLFPLFPTSLAARDPQGPEAPAGDWSDEALDSLLLGDSALDLEAALRDSQDPPTSETNDPEPTAENQLSDAELEALTEELLEEFSLPLWQREITITPGIGYSDNALLTHAQEAGSGYLSTELELMLFRMPGDSGARFFTYALLDHRRYFDVEDLEEETLALLQVLNEQPLGPRWTLHTSALGLYNDEVFGLSPVEDEIIASPVTVSQGSVKTGLFFQSNSTTSLELLLQVDRIAFRERDDDYWQPGLTTRVRWEGNHSRITAGIDWQTRDYDDREQQEPDGSTLPGSSLQTQLLEPYFSCQFETPGDSPWEWGARVAFRQQDDNGPGYHDSQRWKLKAWLEHGQGPWSWELSAVSTFLQYDHRTVSNLDSRRYEITQLKASARAAYQFSPNVDLLLDYFWEEAQSTRPLDSYASHNLRFSTRFRF